MSDTTSASTTRCPHCGREYPYVTIPSFLGVPERRIRSRSCDCEGARAEARERGMRDRQARLREAWARTGVPDEYADVQPDFATLDRIDLEGGHGRYLYGPRGTGKTTAACRLLKAYVARNTDEAGWCGARFVSALDWLDAMQDAYGTYRASAEDEFQRAAGTGFLVFDDMGKLNSRVSDWTIGKLFRLVDERWQHRRPTVFTSKFALGDLAGVLSLEGNVDTPGDMVSRIAQRCERVRFEGPDMRLLSR